MTGIDATNLRDLVAVRKRIDTLERQAAEARARRGAVVASLRGGGMTLEQIAEHVGVTKATVHQWTK